MGHFFEKLIQLEFVCQQSIQEDLRFYNQVAERHEEVKPNFDAKKVVSAVTTDFQRKFAAMASFTDITHNDSIDRFSKSDLQLSQASKKDFNRNLSEKWKELVVFDETLDTSAKGFSKKFKISMEGFNRNLNGNDFDITRLDQEAIAQFKDLVEF